MPAVAVNVSPAHRRDANPVSTVLDALDRHGAAPETLWLELTESALADDRITGALAELRSAGVRLAVDDFGTGWSSLGRLAADHWDLIKIDRSFVELLAGGDDHVRQVVTAMIAMAHALGMLAIAEGVETEEQATILRDLGCDIAQGFLFTRALPFEEVEGFLRQLHRSADVALPPKAAAT